MKVRLTTNHIRIRLAEDEVSALEGGALAACRLLFADGRSLSFQIRPDADTAEFGLDFSDNAVVISVPESWLVGWGESERVGFSGSVPSAGESPLGLLLEKDFPCSHKK